MQANDRIIRQRLPVLVGIVGRTLNYTSVLAICACLLWSSAFAGIKIGLQYTTPLHFAGIRFFIAGLLVLPFCESFKSCWFHMRSSLHLVFFVAFLQTTLLYTFFYLGIEMLPGSVAAIIIGTQPLTVALVAHFTIRRERMTLRKGLSILLGVAGVIIIASTRGEFTLSGGSDLLGIVLLLCSNLSGAAGNIIISRRTARIPPLMLNSAQLMVGGLLLLLLSYAVEQQRSGPYPFEYYAALGWLSFLSAAALSIWFHLLRREDIQISDLNVWKFLIPLSGSCLSWLLVPGESPELATLSGMVLIALALFILHMKYPARSHM